MQLFLSATVSRSQPQKICKWLCSNKISWKHVAVKLDLAHESSFANSVWALVINFNALSISGMFHLGVSLFCFYLNFLHEVEFCLCFRGLCILYLIQHRYISHVCISQRERERETVPQDILNFREFFYLLALTKQLLCY